MAEFNQFRYQNNYNKDKYDRVTILLPKGKKEELKALAKDRGQSVNEYILALLREPLGLG